MVDLPKHVRTKPLAGGRTGYFYEVPSLYRKQGCTVESEPLGTDYSYAKSRADMLNAQFEDWKTARANPQEKITEKVGTVAWLFRVYRQSDAYQKKVSIRSRPDYERVMQSVEDCPTKDKRTLGQLSIRSISPKAADKAYAKLRIGPRGPRERQAEKAINLAGKAWDVVARLHPGFFRKSEKDEHWNPWRGVVRVKRKKTIKPAVTREDVYLFAWGCIELGRPEPAAAAVICFEWLQRPENVSGGHITWTDYRGREHPDKVKIEHHKTGEIVWHPLDDPETGETFYEEAEEIIGHLPRRGTPLILRGSDPAELFTRVQMAKLVGQMRSRIEGVPTHFTLDACRHGGMTELEEAELTDGQGRALSAHKSGKAYRGYAKRTHQRVLGATRKRVAWRRQNAG